MIRSSRWLNQAILALLGAIMALFGVGILFLAFERVPPQAAGRIVAVVVSGALIAAGFRLVHRAVTGRLPRWYMDFLLYVGGIVGSGGAERR